MGIAGMDVRLVRASVIETAEALAGALRSQGMDMKRQPLAGTDQLSGRGKVQPLWRHLWHPGAQVVEAKLDPEDEAITRATLRFSLFPRYRRLLWAGVLLPCVLGNMAMWSALAAADHGYRLLAIGALTSLVAFGPLWWFFLGRLTWPQAFCDRLYAHVANEFGIEHELVEAEGASDSTVLQALSLAGWLPLLLPFIQGGFHNPSVIILIVSLILAYTALAVNRKALDKALPRWPQGFVSFIVNSVLLLYGSFPIWGGILLRSVADALQSPKTRTIPVGQLVFPMAALVVVFAVVGVFVPALRFLNSLPKLVGSLDAVRAQPERVLRITAAENRTLKAISLISGIVIGVGSTAVAVCAIALFCYGIWGDERILGPLREFVRPLTLLVAEVPSLGGSRNTVALATRSLVLLYSLPIIAWIALNLFRNARQLWHYVQLWGMRQQSIPANVQELLQSLTDYAGLKPVSLRIVDWNCRSGFVCIPPIPGFPPLIVVSRRALEELPRQQFAAVLAHEIGHLKHKHVAGLVWLSFLSRCVLLGEGFLHPWLEFSWKLEIEADDFAVRWLEDHAPQTGGRRALLDALKTLERWNIASAISWKRSEEVGFALANSGDWLPQELRTVLDSGANLNPIPWCRARVQLFLCLYFETAGLAYVYLHFSRRIENIQRLVV
jgi:Zn-dependent protease with chaperone function